MGTAYEAAAGITDAMEARDLDRARSYLADNFTFYDPNSPTPPMGADQWMEVTQRLFDAFPDFSYNFEIHEEEGNQVWVSARMEGTHDGDWDLTDAGIGVVPATGIHVSTSRSTTVGIVNADGLIERIEVVEQDENGGMPAIFQQIGIRLG